MLLLFFFFRMKNKVKNTDIKITIRWILTTDQYKHFMEEKWLLCVFMSSYDIPDTWANGDTLELLSTGSEFANTTRKRKGVEADEISKASERTSRHKNPSCCICIVQKHQKLAQQFEIPISAHDISSRSWLRMRTFCYTYWTEHIRYTSSFLVLEQQNNNWEHWKWWKMCVLRVFGAFSLEIRVFVCCKRCVFLISSQFFLLFIVIILEMVWNGNSISYLCVCLCKTAPYLMLRLIACGLYLLGRKI